MRIDYAHSLDASRSMDVRLTSGEKVAVHRLPLRGFIQLKGIEGEVAAALKERDAPRLEQCLGKYIQTGAGLTTYSGLDVFRLFLVINIANRLSGTMAIIEHPSKDQKPEPFEYPNRVYALWVHNLAATYHWSREEILSMYPDEILCYLQEILNDSWKDKEWEWELAGFGWSHKDGKSIRNHFPTPVWAEPKTEITKIKMLKKMLPPGAVVDMGGLGVFTDENTVGESGIRSEGDNAASGGADNDSPVSASEQDSAGHTGG